MLIGESQCFVVTRWNSRENCERRVAALPTGRPPLEGPRTTPAAERASSHSDSRPPGTKNERWPEA